MTLAFPRRRTLGGGIAAGAIGGCLLAAWTLIAPPLAAHPMAFRFATLFEFDASALVGKAAYTSSSYIMLGIGLHFLVAVGWALGYAVLAEGQPQLVTRPILSGAAFGLFVYFAMQIVLVGAGLYVTPAPRELLVTFIGHIGCYGIPVALVVARARRT
jgi:uncharacterized membrane protein YagU involved in acid resistance